MMTRRVTYLCAALAPLLATIAHATSAHAQTGSAIARRIASAADGEVRMTYATRPEVCGDGRGMVGFGSSFSMHGSGESYGRWSNAACVHGPARVAVTVHDHQVVELRTHVGNPSLAGDAVSADLGRVSAIDAAAYFISLAPRAGNESRIDPLLAAAIADSADVVPDMLRIARSSTMSRDTRRHAVHWAGSLGDASVVPALVELARLDDGGESVNAADLGPGNQLQSAAVAALSMVRDGAGVPALMDLARRGSPVSRKAAVFWLGQRDEPQARALVRTIAADEHESESLRGSAIFALGQGESVTSADRTFLRTLFGKLTNERLQERVVFSLSQNGNTDDLRWMLAQARDDRLPMEVRRKAVFWAGQGHVPIADLLSLYHDAREPRLREHLIFVLSQRDDERAVPALMDIARTDGDREMRKKALFWLSQKDDPRVTKLLSDMIAR